MQILSLFVFYIIIYYNDYYFFMHGRKLWNLDIILKKQMEIYQLQQQNKNHNYPILIYIFRTTEMDLMDPLVSVPYEIPQIPASIACKYDLTEEYIQHDEKDEDYNLLLQYL